jgi:hypothetical protein
MSSSVYRVHLLLNLCRESALAEEEAILHGKVRLPEAFGKMT